MLLDESLILKSMIAGIAIGLLLVFFFKWRAAKKLQKKSNQKPKKK